MSAAAVMQRAAAAGVKLKLVDGKVKALGKREAVDQLLEELRQCKAEIVLALESVGACASTPIDVPQIGTIRPPGLTPKLLAASLALDAQILAAGLSLMPEPAHWHAPQKVIIHAIDSNDRTGSSLQK